MACGASLAIVYEGYLGRLLEAGKLPGNGDVVIIVCGGSAVSLEVMQEWKTLFTL